MIAVQLNKEGFENDIHSLVKAFFPPEDVSVYTKGKKLDKKEPASFRLSIFYEEASVRIELQEPAKAILKERMADAGHMQNKALSDEKPMQNEVLPDEKLMQNEALSEAKEPSCEWNTIQAKEAAMDLSNHSRARSQLKQCLYQLLSAYTGKQLPWGTLTGVRPTRLVMRMRKEGKADAAVLSQLKDAYEVSAKKAALALEIAKREQTLLDRLDYKKGYSLYVGIPFCPTTCLYCSFPSYPVSKYPGQIDDYLKALEREITFTAEHFRERSLNTVYIGGGTPTTLSPEQLERLISKIKFEFNIKAGLEGGFSGTLLEFTVEAGRPDSITQEKLEVLRKQGISRISINPQTMKQETLDLIGRRHTVEQTVESFKLARRMGFNNINMDLIMGLPEETTEDAAYTLKMVQELAPDNVTVHSLALKRAARLAMFKEDYAGLSMVNTWENLEQAEAACRQMGLQPYYLYRQKNMAGNFENVGYASTGKEGLYNILIMEEVQDIVALGAGSISKRVWPDGRIQRCANVKEVAQYIDRIGEMIERKRALYSQ